MKCDPIVKLNWQWTDPRLDPFATLSGLEDGVLESVATCSAHTEAQIENALQQLVSRTVLLAERLVQGAECVLFLWDPVYVQLTILFTDRSLYRDGPVVTQCKFPLLDEEYSRLSQRDAERWDLETARLSQEIRGILARLLERQPLPAQLEAFFSDQERACFPPEEFQVARISPPRA